MTQGIDSQSAQRIELTVDEKDAGVRLDKLLAQRVEALSRARIQALIRAGSVAGPDGATIGDGSYRVKPGELKGTWRLSGISTSDHATPIGELTFSRGADAKTVARCEATSKPEVTIPSLVLDHFNASDAAGLERELRRVDARTIVGRWAADISPLYARFISASPGLFHRETERGKRRHILRYTLSSGS